MYQMAFLIFMLGSNDNWQPRANQSLPPRNGGSRKKRSTSHAERDGEKRSLTEGAVDDFAARCWTDLRASDRNVRATNYMAAALRRRSLAPVR